MAKQLNVSLAFSADTSKAKAQLQDLQRQLANLTNSTGRIGGEQGLGITKQLHEASAAAAQLQVHLQNATNVNTGKLDLVKFNQSLKASNMDLQRYKDQLMTLGPAGAQAFSGLAAAITNAEAPMFRASARVRELGTVLKNTVRWQLSSSMLHGFIGAIQGAYGYAKDLNESLNNIRIVTGQSTDQMAKFAKEANKAAKALSSTTTEYTDAALIYYQQGLSGEQVKERAEVTLKMANVSRQSAETVSQQMTSVWNNFYDGGKSLEYYSDVMVALGAATASSSDEIATGLEKFSAVSNTVGLSYEYAAAALATVTAQTRQSADTVGTAFRTLFTRLEGLNLGETAEDGTTLNKYSEALYKVGVNIKDQQGQLKDMDQILDELGAKWQTIGKEQQVALAQTVGGARQYATLIALMDNWDFFQKNLGTAKNAEGSLQEQADTYAESWEAARERVTASLQRIYNELLNDKFFISLNDGFAGFLDIIGNIVDGLGGLKGVLLTIGTILINVYQKQLATGLTNLMATVHSWTAAGREEARRTKEEASSLLRNIQMPNAPKLYENQAKAQQAYLNNVKAMSEEEQKIYGILMQQQEALAGQVIKKAELVNLTHENSGTTETKFNIRHPGLSWATAVSNIGRDADLSGESYKKLAMQEQHARQIIDSHFTPAVALGNLTPGGKEAEAVVQNLRTQLDALKTAGGDLNQTFGTSVANAFDNLENSLKGGGQNIKAVKTALDELNNAVTTQFGPLETLRTNINELEQDDKELAIALRELIAAWEEEGRAKGQSISAQMNHNIQTENLVNQLDGLKNKVKTFQEQIVGFAQGLGAAAMAMSSIMSLSRTWANEDLKTSEKLVQTMQTMAFLLPTLATLLSKFVNSKAVETIVTKANTVAKNENNTASALQVFWNKLIAKSLDSVMSAMIALTVSITAAIVVVTLLVKAFNEWKKSTPAEQLKSAAKATEDAAKAAEEAAAAYDELVNKINNIDSATEKLNDLTKGTAEYQKALSDVNNELLELIKKYNLIEGTDYNIVDGVISLTDAGKSKTFVNANYEASAANRYARSTGIYNNKLNNNIAIQDKLISASFWRTDERGNKTEFIDSGFLSADEKQYLANQLKNKDISAIKTDDIKSLLLAENSPFNLRGEFLTDNADEFAKALLENNAFDSFISALQDNTAAIEATMKVGISEELSGNAYFKNLDVASQKVVTDLLALEQEELYNQKLDSWNSNDLTEQDYNLFAAANGFKAIGKTLYKQDENGNSVAVTEDYSTQILALKAQEESRQEALNKFIEQDVEFLRQVQENVALLSEKDIAELYKVAETSKASTYDLDHAGWKAVQDEIDEDLPGLNSLIEDYNNLAIEATEKTLQWAKQAGKLTTVLDDNKDALSDKNNVIDYQKALTTISEEASNLIGINVDSDFTEKYLPKIKEMANGSREALLELKKAALIEYTTELDPESAENAKTEVLNLFNTLTNLPTIDLHAEINQEELENIKLVAQKIAEIFGWSAAEASEFFKKSLNLDIPLKTKEVTLSSMSQVQFSGGTAYTSVDGKQYALDSEQIAQLSQGVSITIPILGESELDWDAAKFTGFSTQPPIITDSKSKGSKKSKKKASDEIERYHVIKEQLEDIEQELDRISKAKDRAFGGDKLKLMDDEIAKTQELLDKEQEYFDQINANYGPDRKALEAYGAKFDANGALLNYDSLMNAQINAFNSSLSDEAEEKYNNFKELIDKYEETDDLLAEQRQKLIDLQNELFDLMLEKLEYEVTLKIDVNEDANKYLDFLMEMNGDGMDHALDNIDALGEKIANGMEDIETYTNSLNNMFKNRGYKGNVVEDLQSGKVTPEELAEMYDLTEAEVDLLREYMGNIMDVTKEIQNMRKEITDQLIDAMEEINKKFDEQIDKINRAAEGMQHYRDIIDLVGQDVLGISDEMMKTFGEKQLDNSIANVKASRTKMLENEREYNEAVAELERLKDSGASEFAIEEQERVVEAAREHLYDSTDEFNSVWKETLEQARQLFDDTIKSITDNFEKAMSGIYGNLDALQDAYDRQSEINERYLEDYEKIYELSKLNRDIGNSIDSTDNIKAKQELMKLQEEINALEESGAEISKYDLDFLRQKYELRLAEIALEEAQNAKSQVRMTRDSEGNWNYTYTANEENISKAEQNYEDALYKTQQLTTDYIKDLENRIFQLNTDLVNALSNVDPNDTEGRQRIYDYYMGQNNYLTSQLNNALGNNADIYNQDWMNYSNATGYKISDNEKWMDSFNETTLSMLTGYSSLGDYQNAFRDSSLLMYNSINDAASEFAANTELVMNSAGTSIETFAEDAEEAFKNFTISTKEATDSIDGIDKEAKETFDAILEKLVEFNKAYDEQIQQTIKANQDLIKSFNDLIAKEAEAKAGGGSGSNNSFSGSGNNGKNDPSGPSEPPTSPLTNNVVVEETWSAWKDTGAKRSEGNKVEKQQYRISNKNRTEYRWITTGTNVTAGRNGYTSFTTVSMYDTGGYTGAWGTTAGKLAMLHEKELVLNKEDTENILQSVNLVRQISDWISGRVNAMQYGSMLSAFGLPGDNKNVLEQIVTIHAEFPNANNRAEIEAAFDNLVNRAAQYAYRK